MCTRKSDSVTAKHTRPKRRGKRLVIETRDCDFDLVFYNELLYYTFHPASVTQLAYLHTVGSAIPTVVRSPILTSVSVILNSRMPVTDSIFDLCSSCNARAHNWKIFGTGIWSEKAGRDMRAEYLPVAM